MAFHESAERGAGGLLGLAMRAMIRVYQLLLRPLLPPSCRFTPSCSHYAAEAIARHGPWRGLGLAVRRLLRCHPWGGCGDDPVPGHAAGPVRGHAPGASAR